MTIWGYRRRDALLRMRRSEWDVMIAELGRRGEGRREAGAFLLADRDGAPTTVTRVVYLDDLDPNCLTGGITFDGLAYSKLWDICDAEHRRVIGDVHTHPGGGVRQSPIDAANPMLAQAGHVALIVPHFATSPTKPRAVGVHLYDGEGWHTWTGREAEHRLFVGRWV
jgi:proteasome lid subunit RPN8/RPN11